MKNKLRNAIAAAAITMALATGIASAQTSTTTNTTTAVPTSVTTPGTPNTGSGGNAAGNWLILAATGAVVLGGITYLSRRPKEKSN